MINRYRADLLDGKDAADPEFLPYLLVMTRATASGFSEAPWEAVETPIRKAELQSRIAVLLRARDYSLELSRQNPRLKRFASVVSHDLRNPLTVAKGRLELVQSECDSEQLDAVSKAHHRMQALIDDVLSLARSGRKVPELEVVELHAVAQAAWRYVRTDESTLSVASERSIHADRSRLQGVFENLMRNAVEHAGAEVAITVGDLPDGFYVEDDGAGLPQPNRPTSSRLAIQPMKQAQASAWVSSRRSLRRMGGTSVPPTAQRLVPDSRLLVSKSGDETSKSVNRHSHYSCPGRLLPG